MIENNGPGGYYAEIARTLVLGKASNEMIDGFEAMREAQDYTLSLMKPGASCADIANAHDDYMKQRGFELEIRLYAHSQGYDMVERPMLRADETMPLEENMNFAVHPGYNTSTMWMTICDNYMVEANGVERLPAQDREEDFRDQLADCRRGTETKIMPRLLILLTLPPARPRVLRGAHEAAFPRARDRRRRSFLEGDAAGAMTPTSCSPSGR